VKLKQIEKIYTLFEKIPKSFSISIQAKILQNKKIVESEFQIIEELKKNLYAEDYVKFSQEYNSSENKSEVISKFSEAIQTQEKRNKEFEEHLSKIFSGNLVYINISELPDDITELDKETLETIFLITKE